MNLHLPQYTASLEEIQASPNNQRLVKKWQNGLELVNMGETTRQVYKCLRNLNRQQINPRSRFEMMEQLKPMVRLVLKHLNKHLHGVTFPLLGKSAQITKLNHALLLEGAVAYKHVVHDSAAKGGKIDQKSLMIATHRAMRYLEESVACNAAIYRTDPTSTWHDIHRLQGFAEHSQFADTMVVDKDYATIEGSTISDVFKQACLLAMTQPLRLRSGESDNLRTYFESAVHLASFTKKLIPDSNGRVHVVSLKSSEPPAFIPLADITTFSNLRGFDLTRLISTLNDIADSSGDAPVKAGFSKVQLEPQLIRRLINTWSTEEKRRFSRVSTNRGIVAAIGLHRIISAIHDDLQPEFTREELFVGSNISTPSDARLSDQFYHTGNDSFAPQTHSDLSTFDPTYRNDIMLGGEIASSPAQKTGQPDTWLDWQVTNTGAAGYGLEWKKETPSLARVGELMALREKEYNIHHWRIGITRWIKNPNDGGLQIGVQLIAPRALVVSVDSIANRNQSETMPIEALMLPGMKTIEQPPSILVPNQFFTLGDILEISMLGKKLRIELNSLGESPSFYSQFFYRSSTVKEETVKSREEFEDLWSRL